MVIRNLENKIKLVGIICSFFLAGCIIISVSSIWTARTMVTDAQKKVYVLDGNVPILVNRTTMDETLDVEAKSHVEMFHHFFFTLPPDDKYIKYTDGKGDVPGGRDRTCTVQHAQRERLLLQHLGNECRILHLLRQCTV